MTFLKWGKHRKEQRERVKRDTDKHIEKVSMPQDREEINRRLAFIDARISNMKRTR